MSGFEVNQQPEGKFKVVFLGTGVSTAVPNLQHIINTTAVPCKVCHDALLAGSKNRRNNVSVGIVFADESGGQKCVVIDVGKTMRDGCLRLFPQMGISEVAGIILTHGHADAIFGLDDVRDLQISRPTAVLQDGVENIGFKVLSGPMPVYLNETTYKTVKQGFNYLTEKPIFLDEAAGVLDRRIAFLDFRVIDSNSMFNVAGLPVRSFPVYHGGTYVSLGFSIGKESEFVYISDVKIIPEETMQYLISLPKIKVFVIDVLDPNGGIFAHMGLKEALAVVELLKPELAYFVGMSCSIGLHEEMEAKLSEIAPNTHLAFDGLVLEGFDLF